MEESMQIAKMEAEARFASAVAGLGPACPQHVVMQR